MYSHTPCYPVGESPSLSASVLATFPPDASRSVVASIVAPIASKLGPHIKPPTTSDGAAGLATAAAAVSAPAAAAAAAASQDGAAVAIKTEAQIDWFMEASCH